ncbi:MAG TPA: hypothetical protein VHK69_14890 [Chitinophagaceae bacterium]|nr:hypothetical protein [Chitinophagaceae bacterium]
MYGSLRFSTGGRPPLHWLKEVFLPEGVLVNNNGGQAIRFTVDSFIQTVEAQLEGGSITALREEETAARTECFGRIAHRFSTYALYLNDGATPVSEGINSIQLIQDAEGWKVSALVWNDGTPDLPIPDKYRN